MRNKTNATKAGGLAAPMLLFGALMTAVLLPLRLWQQLNTVEEHTGFWKTENWDAMALYIGLALLIAVPVIAALIFRRQTALDVGRRSRIPEGILALLVGVTLVMDAYTAFQFAVKLFSDFGRQVILEGYETQSGSPLQYFIRTGAVAALLETLFGVGGMLFFVNLALADFLPRKRVPLQRFLALMPLFWCICRLLGCFSRMINFLRVSDLFLNILMLTLLMLFFLAFAQTLSGINCENKAFRLLGAGIPALVLMLLCFVPRLAAYRIQGFAAPQDASIAWCDPILALFLAVFLAGRLVRVRTDAEKDKEATGTDDPAEEDAAAEA
jgi:hypothetical protein